jgi:hypothetical protein
VPVSAAAVAAVREYRRGLADAMFGAAAREHVLGLIRGGVPVGEAAATVNVSAAAVYGRARWDVEFAARLDAALDEASAPRKSIYCGTPTGYRSRQCKCRPCRTAHTNEARRYRY